MSTIAKAIAAADHPRNDGAAYTLHVHLVGGASVEVDVYGDNDGGHFLRRRAVGQPCDRQDIAFNEAAILFVEVEY